MNRKSHTTISRRATRPDPDDLATGYDPASWPGDDGAGLFTVRAPRREEVDPNDRANRILPDVYWDAILAGAIHRVRVSGVVRV